MMEATKTRLLNEFHRTEAGKKLCVRFVEDLRRGDTCCYPNLLQWRHSSLLTEERVKELLPAEWLGADGKPRMMNKDFVITGTFDAKTCAATCGVYLHDGQWKMLVLWNK